MGKLTVITGVMGSGKSAQYWKLLERGHEYMAFSTAKDSIESRNGCKKSCMKIEKYFHLHTIFEWNANKKKIFIDEGQWLTWEQAEHIVLQANKGWDIVVVGLDKDFENVPFYPMEYLVKKADKHVKLKAMCTYCTEEATTHIKIDVEGNAIDNKDEMFKAVCEDCQKIYG